MNTAKKTTQETFDTVVTGLRKQGKKSVIPGTISCRYRSPDGLKCAAGMLIDDEFYSHNLEGTSVWMSHADGGVRESLIKSGVDTCDLDMVYDLQQIHDQKDVSEWEIRWENLASKLHLTMPAKEETETEVSA